MKYGYFDDEKREYVITNPATPKPWVNYLGSPLYGALVSNNAGGYSFAKSGANGRSLRYVFNNFDQPGRYIYLRDNDSKDYWSASWQPVGKDLKDYKSECHHGTAYTNIMADYAGIHSEALYYVPLESEHEVWKLKVTNTSDKKRSLTVTGFGEFTNNSNGLPRISLTFFMSEVPVSFATSTSSLLAIQRICSYGRFSRQISTLYSFSRRYFKTSN